MLLKKDNSPRLLNVWKKSSIRADGPTASYTKVKLFKSNERTARMNFKRIEIDTSKHVFSIERCG